MTPTNGIKMQEKKDFFKEKKWIVKTIDTEKNISQISDIATELGINPIIARLLYSRGYTNAVSMKKFIYMESEMLSNPFDMQDMELGIKRVHDAVKLGEKITIYGDYDVDGVTAVCTLYLYLKSKGANVGYYIPNRASEGYGVSTSAINTLKDNGTKLIITVDTGITANSEVEYAKTQGIDFVITDHHECHADLPSAVAVINPHRHDCRYPFKELAGVGVVFKFVSAYEEMFEVVSRITAATRVFSDYADLVAIGTIADVMPIRDENRLIVSYGLNMLETTERYGIKALINLASQRGDSNSKGENRKKRRTKMTSGFIGYTLAPRLNAAGRIKSAELAVELFLAETYEKAELIAEQLCAANKERQLEENKIIEEANKKIEAIDIEKYPVIVLDADDWHHGVIGIVSSRITEKYSRPSILISFKKTDNEDDQEIDIGKGSGRSIKGLNLVDALYHCSEYLVKFGGHELAAGLSVERSKLKPFRDSINEYARNNLSKADMVPTLEADIELDFRDINLKFAEELQILEPYGVGNPVPSFIIKGVYINEIAPISDGKHTRFVFSNGTSSISGMFFSHSPKSTGVFNGEKVDVLFNIDINEWLGKRTVQFIIKDIMPSYDNILDIDMQKKRYKEIHDGAPFDDSEDVVPTRDDFAKLYKFLYTSLRSGINAFTHRELMYKLSPVQTSKKLTYTKLKIMLKVFAELNILGIEETEDDIYQFKLLYYSSKTDLDKSTILKKIKQQRRKVNL